MNTTIISPPQALSGARIVFRSVLAPDKLASFARRGVVLSLLGMTFLFTWRFELAQFLSASPTAGLIVFPIAGMVIAGIKYRTRSPTTNLNDRFFDYIVGLPCLGLALLLAFAAPTLLYTLFWTYRLDVLAQFFFLLGALLLLCGARFTWRVREFPLFLLLSWPFFYTTLFSSPVAWFETLTTRGVDHLATLFSLPISSLSPLFNQGSFVLLSELAFFAGLLFLLPGKVGNKGLFTFLCLLSLPPLNVIVATLSLGLDNFLHLTKYNEWLSLGWASAELLLAIVLFSLLRFPCGLKPPRKEPLHGPQNSTHKPPKLSF